jgi:hypothetical protein
MPVPTGIAALTFHCARARRINVDGTLQRSSTMPVILWLLGVPLGVILLFMLIF